MASIKLIRSNIATIDNAADISLGDVTVSTTAPTASNIIPGFDERTDSPPAIAAGKLRVAIYNMGFVEDGDNEVTIDVNGEPLQPYAPPMVFEAQLDPVNNIFKYTPAITVDNSGGARIRIITQE